MATKKKTKTIKELKKAFDAVNGIPDGAPDPADVPIGRPTGLPDTPGQDATTIVQVKEPSPLTPEPKVAAGGFSGAVIVLILYAASQAGIDIPAEVAVAISTLVSFGVAWVTSNKKS